MWAASSDAALQACCKAAAPCRRWGNAQLEAVTATTLLMRQQEHLETRPLAQISGFWEIPGITLNRLGENTYPRDIPDLFLFQYSCLGISHDHLFQF
jgi:hypothetical protein